MARIVGVQTVRHILLTDDGDCRLQPAGAEEI